MQDTKYFNLPYVFFMIKRYKSQMMNTTVESIEMNNHAIISG